jgi:hypothetical protein
VLQAVVSILGGTFGSADQAALNAMSCGCCEAFITILLILVVVVHVCSYCSEQPDFTVLCNSSAVQNVFLWCCSLLLWHVMFPNKHLPVATSLSEQAVHSLQAAAAGSCDKQSDFNQLWSHQGKCDQLVAQH